jgi:hypothetical protein
VPCGGNVEPVILEGSDEVACSTDPRVVPKLTAEEDVVVLFEIREGLQKWLPVAVVNLCSPVQLVDWGRTLPVRVGVIVLLQYVRETVGPCLLYRLCKLVDSPLALSPVITH